MSDENGTPHHHYKLVMAAKQRLVTQGYPIRRVDVNRANPMGKHQFKAEIIEKMGCYICCGFGSTAIEAVEDAVQRYKYYAKGRE
jgi:hypothetical protein